jgi:hypothetical protein
MNPTYFILNEIAFIFFESSMQCLHKTVYVVDGSGKEFTFLQIKHF